MSNGGHGGREAVIVFEAGVVVATKVVVAPVILTLYGGDYGIWFAPDPDKDPNEGTTNGTQGFEWLRCKPGEGLVTLRRTKARARIATCGAWRMKVSGVGGGGIKAEKVEIDGFFSDIILVFGG